ncbi:MAG: efflux RND transporter periplasmic adaptor subunit [Burkholderiales bacterium]|nr:Macrolide export protein MacA [Rhodocyclaceae bacterium]MCZ2420773.1 efflux RND transporter periplasmic adaptor subunit [Burkholderiales bacterium]
MKTPVLRNILIAAAVLAVLAGLTFSLTRPKPIAVAVATVESGKVETTVANTRAGSVAACRRAKLAPPLGGRIDKLLVREGDRVKTGQVLVELWNDDLSARERISIEQRGTAQAHLREACLIADTARRNAERTRALRDKGFVSEERVDQAESEAKAKQAGCDSARAQVQEAGARIGASRADTSRTVVKAPFDGIVAEVNGEVGEYLTPSPPGIPTLPAIDLIDDACLYVTAPIDEVDAAQLKVGMTGRISLDAYRGKHFTGKLRRIAPYVLALEKQARTVEVEVDFESPAEIRHLLVGYSADIEVVVDARDNVLRIPTSALMPGSRVLVLTEDGALEERKIEAGLSNWEFTEAKSGLARGDRVVTSLERAGVKAGVRAVAEEKPATKKP